MTGGGQAHDDDPDLDALHGVAAGRADACRRLVDRHLGPLHAFAARMLDDAAEAEDVCQESFVKLWQIAPRWRAGEARVSTWLYRVALNDCRDRLRRRRGEPLDADTLPSEQAGPERQHEQRELGDRVRALLAELPDRQREALLLFHVEGHSQSEVADIMQVSTEALESLLSRGRRSLRQRATAEREDSR